jgi:peptidoglycan/xylan/chitin deacetylase (PgdA/CDA1 family)
MSTSGVSRQVSRHWTPSPLLYVSAALHLGAAVATLLRPSAWAWSLSAIAINHVLLAGAGLSPRSQLLGPNWTSLPEGNEGAVAVTIDDGPNPDITPKVLDLLDAHGATATFFCVGERVLKYADLAQEIVRRGHAIENHSQHHRHNFSLLGPRGIASEVSQAQDSISRVCGVTPRFFRAPAGLRNPFLDPVLAHLDLTLASWTRRGFDTVNGNADSVYDKLSDSLAACDILLLHDGHCARTRADNPVVLEVLPRLLETIRTEGLRPVTLRAAKAA